MVANSNMREATQLAIHKRCPVVQVGSTEKDHQKVARTGLKPATSGFQARGPTRPHGLQSARVINDKEHSQSATYLLYQQICNSSGLYSSCSSNQRVHESNKRSTAQHIQHLTEGRTELRGDGWWTS